jgi:hypothetical protein
MARPTNALWLWLCPCVADESEDVKSLRACMAAALPREEEDAGSEWLVVVEAPPKVSKNLRWDWTASVWRGGRSR